MKIYTVHSTQYTVYSSTAAAAQVFLPYLSRKPTYFNIEVSTTSSTLVARCCPEQLDRQGPTEFLTSESLFPVSQFLIFSIKFLVNWGF